MENCADNLLWINIFETQISLGTMRMKLYEPQYKIKVYSGIY